MKMIRFAGNRLSRRNYSTSFDTLKISSIGVYKVDLPLHEGNYNWSGGKSVSIFDSTVLVVKTNDPEIEGYGEVCPLGPFYLPAYAKGVRTGLEELAPYLIGKNPVHLQELNHWMDKVLKGHPYVKSAVDMACWDILGKKCGLPVYALLGGKFMEDVPLYRAISQESPEQMATKVQSYRKEGYKKFQLKVGGNPNEDILRIKACRKVLDPTDVLVADANTGWLPHEAQRVVRGVADIDVYIEQPCLTLNECLLVRQNSTHPFILDEIIDNVYALLEASKQRAMDCINIKISKFGGLTNAKQGRDLAVSLGLSMILEDSWGGDIITAAIAHLAQSTPPANLFAATDFNSYVTQSIATGAPQRKNGFMRAPPLPGLGITPRMDVLGQPLAVYK